MPIRESVSAIIKRRMDMANNFFLNQDPLLYQGNYSRLEPMDARRYDDTLQQYNRLLQQQPNQVQKDYVGDLDRLNKSLSEEVILELNNDKEYQRLNGELLNMIQEEIMVTIKWKINSNPNAIKNIEKQTELINNAKKEKDEEQRKSLSELNDYVKNYSNITFDEYKRIKSDENR